MFYRSLAENGVLPESTKEQLNLLTFCNAMSDRCMKLCLFHLLASRTTPPVYDIIFDSDAISLQKSGSVLQAVFNVTSQMPLLRVKQRNINTIMHMLTPHTAPI